MAEEKKPSTTKKASTPKKKKEEVVDTPLPTTTLAEADAVVVNAQGEEEVLDFTQAEAPVVEQAKTEEEQKVEAAAQGQEETMQVPSPVQLSKQAQGWRDWLAYQKLTPEDFIKRYPSHKMRHLIQEIIDFNAKK